MGWKSVDMDGVPTSCLHVRGDGQVENRYLCGPRLASELTGAAKAAIANKRRGWLSIPDGVGKLLKCLREMMSEPALPEIANQLRAYFKLLRRKRG